VAYVGQLSRVVLDHDRASKPLKSLVQADVAPFTTHAYLVSRDGAAFLANHLQFILARAGSPHARAPFYMNADAPQQFPWGLTALDVKIDFYMIETHRYYFSREASLTKKPAWFSFESTKAVPASFGRGGVRWSKNGDVQLGHANADKCAADKPDYVPCEAALAAASPCGPASRRLPSPQCTKAQAASRPPRRRRPSRAAKAHLDGAWVRNERAEGRKEGSAVPRYRTTMEKALPRMCVIAFRRTSRR
jgi:hypothetical protein